MIIYIRDRVRFDKLDFETNSEVTPWVLSLLLIHGSLTNGDFEWYATCQCYGCDLETFNWWVKALHSADKLADRIKWLRREYGHSFVDNAIRDVADFNLWERVRLIDEALDAALKGG